jgi:nicotinamide-nucleotide amidase
MTLFSTAELISTGDELLSGRSLNRHAQVLGERLGRIGIRLTRDTTIGDDRENIATTLRQALERTSLVIVSGGLGPTNDDVTRDAVAEVVGSRVVMDAYALRLLRDTFAKRGRPVTPARERQALIVEGATVLPNTPGIAPGELLAYDGKTIIMLPGPPVEFTAILDEHVMPWLGERTANRAALRERVLLTSGIAESDIVTHFQEAGFPPAGIHTAYCAGSGRVEIRLHPLGDTEDAALDHASDTVAALLGDYVYARERVTMETLIGQWLTSHAMSLATAESCTGGMIGARLTDVPGSSAYFKGGIVAYSNDIKARSLSVPTELLEKEGAVSAPVAEAMAVGTQKLFQADWAVSVTGIAGPGGGTEDKPVGLVYIAVAGPGSVGVEKFQFPGTREVVRECTVRAALDMLRKAFLKT